MSEPPSIHSPHRAAIAGWLFAIAAMVFAMVVLGGVTRLTHSGLSMVTWRPLTGWLPPFDAADWQAAFADYQRFPEYKKINPNMELAEFKTIYWLEYLHRLWGRLIGVVFLLPFVIFVVRGWVGRHLGIRLFALFILGSLQGLLGWIMVQSGLVDRPDVSPYRLTAHLGLAAVIYGYVVWLALGLVFPGRAPPSGAAGGSLWRLSLATAGLVFLTILSGGFVAGLDAGLSYNTFPLMGGRLVPEGLFDIQPLVLNFFENIATVQFDHRLLSLTVLVLIGAFWWRARQAGLTRRGRIAVDGLLIVAVVQVGLGISTLLLAVPVPLAALHQAGALALFTFSLLGAHALRP